MRTAPHVVYSNCNIKIICKIKPVIFMFFLQSHGETSRPIWLQVAESAYRFTLGSIAGGELFCNPPGTVFTVDTLFTLILFV